MFKLVADEICLESGVRLLLHSLVVGCRANGSRIRSVTVAGKSGSRDVDARVYVDATGDADLAFAAGVPCEKGRAADGLSQPMTLNFRMAGVDPDRLPSRQEITKLYLEARSEGRVDCPRDDVLYFHTTRPGEDVLEGRRFADRVARGSYPVDIHDPDGGGTVLKHLRPGESYDIPYRCLVPLRVDNLLVAGRPISCTHEAHSSIRVMPIACAVGHAAGAAAALCAGSGAAPRELPVDELQRTLLMQGANLGRENRRCRLIKSAKAPRFHERRRGGFVNAK